MGTTVFGICVTTMKGILGTGYLTSGGQGRGRLGRHENPSLIRYDLKNEWKLAS